MYIIEFSALAETNVEIKENEEQPKYVKLIGELRNLYSERIVH